MNHSQTAYPPSEVQTHSDPGLDGGSFDLRSITGRLASASGSNVVLSFEGAQVKTRTHAEVSADVLRAAARLRDSGVTPGMRVGIRAPNSYHWMIHDLALLHLRALSVAFTDDFAELSAQQLIADYSLGLILVTAGEWDRTRPECEQVARVDGERWSCRALAAQITEPDTDFSRPALAFSSGSSGHRKGLILSRRGIEATVAAFTAAVAPVASDRFLLFLPMSNFQQRMMYYSALLYGFDVIIADPSCLFRALSELAPTLLIAPPLFYETIETRFYNLPPFKKWLAYAWAGLLGVVPQPDLRKRLARLVFSDVYSALGGRMRFMVTGMAPIRASALRLFQRMQLPVYETYGLTEVGSISLNVPGAARRGSVGRTFPGVNLTFAVDGEIIVSRDYPLATGYFECAPGEQERTFIGDTQVATGDIGYLDGDGYLHLTGRKKEIIVTRGGEKMHPELLEAGIEKCDDVAKSVVYYDHERNLLSAVIVLRDATDPQARNRIQRHVDRMTPGSKSLTIASLVFTGQSFSRENELLLPNLKVDRSRVVARFASESSSGPGGGDDRGKSL